MKSLKTLGAFLGSRTLTVWLVGGFILFYLTIAVWSKEAFATYVTLLSKNNLFRATYALFLCNIAIRSLSSLRSLWPKRVTFFLRVPLYAGFVIFLISFAMSLNVRKNIWLVVGEGDVPEIPWEQSAFQVVHVAPALEKRALRTSGSAVFDYEPSLTLADRGGVEKTVGAFPPRLLGSTYMHVLNFGIGPGVELKKRNEVIAKGYMALRLTPFGSVDTFELPPSPYKFYLSILPSRIIRKGSESARDYDLAKPLYRIEVEKGDRIIARGETDSAVSFDGDMTLSFFAPSDWVLLEAVHDPFYPGFVASLLLLCAGLLLLPFSFLSRNRPGASPGGGN